MRNILIRNLYKNDYEIINFWLNNPVIKEKKKKFKIKNNKNIKIIISDNIRVGLQLKKKIEYIILFILFIILLDILIKNLLKNHLVKILRM